MVAAATLIHLISIPGTNTSVNPARSTGVAVFVGGWAVGQLWLFWLAPIAGALLGALLYGCVREVANASPASPSAPGPGERIVELVGPGSRPHASAVPSQAIAAEGDNRS